MPILKTAPVAPVKEPTFEDRFNSANAIAGSARSRFLLAANDLEDAARELDYVAQEAQQEIDSLEEIVTNADNDAEQHRQAAANLRALVEPTQLALF